MRASWASPSSTTTRLELLLHDDGSVAGAAGHARLVDRPWTARAGAMVMATGGCAFRSGLLMAAEAGAALSGMEDFVGANSLSARPLIKDIFMSCTVMTASLIGLAELIGR